MSMYADMVETFRDAKESYGLTEQQCAELLWDVCGNLQWGCFELASGEYDDDAEILLAKEELFGREV